MIEKSLLELDFASLTRRTFTPSPAAWEDQVLYFLLLDRFSDGSENGYYDNDGNLVTTGNARVITAVRSAGTGTLQGTLTATTVNGVATFADLSHNLATTITINFTSSGLTSTTSSNIVVSPAAFAQLQLLVPGETAAPGRVVAEAAAAMQIAFRAYIFPTRHNGSSLIPMQYYVLDSDE